MITVICGILIFCMMILPHEFGHFITAKACDVKINEFSMGMGPALFKKQKGETLYSLRLLPIGGYCAMEGEDGENENDRAFVNKKPWQKCLILFAGAGMNILVAIVIMIGLTFYSGVATTTIGSVQADSPAYEAGIKAGDELVSVDGKSIDKWADLGTAVAEADDDDNLTVTVLRDGDEMTFKTSSIESDGRRIIGVTTAVTHSFIPCLKGSFANFWHMSTTLISAFVQLFTGQVGLDQMGGPVAIVKIAGDAGAVGVSSFLYLVAFISVNLAIFNLLPLPALDGGRIVFVVLRKITGRDFGTTFETKYHFAGLMILFAFMIFITYNDVMRILK